MTRRIGRYKTNYRRAMRDLFGTQPAPAPQASGWSEDCVGGFSGTVDGKEAECCPANSDGSVIICKEFTMAPSTPQGSQGGGSTQFRLRTPKQVQGKSRNRRVKRRSARGRRRAR